ncbi:hypothetical protein fugu_002227 [Takifugu bimaculatus]|uniref:Uncharacterized protein n=1 Tax=Takifugu bimaculatus TaxID=433685 RepID=A0A4Z2BP27_9TELE|nr:hypothetical protein fugu_002227 [Takifugu bimaculatus]
MTFMANNTIRWLKKHVKNNLSIHSKGVSQEFHMFYKDDDVTSPLWTDPVSPGELYCPSHHELCPEGNETRHQHKAAAAAGQTQTKLFSTCQIPPPTASSKLYLFNQVQAFLINVGVVQAGAWIYKKKVCH